MSFLTVSTIVFYLSMNTYPFFHHNLCKHIFVFHEHIFLFCHNLYKDIFDDYFLKYNFLYIILVDHVDMRIYFFLSIFTNLFSNCWMYFIFDS